MRQLRFPSRLQAKGEANANPNASRASLENITPRGVPRKQRCSVAPQHAVHQVAKRAPKVFAARQIVLIDKEHILLEAGVQVWLQPKLADDGVVVAVDVGVDTVHALEDLAHERRERFGKRHTCI